MSTATQVWKKWQGQTVDGKFQLLHELGGSDHSIVFLTERPGREPRRAAIKLIPVAGRDDDAQLAHWAAAAMLDHRHLIRLYESGRCQLDGGEYLYVVMDYAEEDLSQILPQRPLTPEETADVIQPTSEVLAYLHQMGFVHGRLKPSNVLAVDNRLRVSADGLCRKGERAGSRRLTVFDAPEVPGAGLLPEADVWSLGVLLVSTLTQYPPDFTNSSPPQAIVPETVPEPFRGIARRCLAIDPHQRCNLREIQSTLDAQAPPATPEPGQKIEAQADKKPSRRSALVIAAVVVALLAVLGVRAILAHRPAVPAAQTTQPASETTSEPPSSPPPFAEPPNQPQGTVAGKVLRQVVPNVPQGARNTITGKVKVNVEVSVDPAGKVSEVRLTLRGPSAYFARLAQESARQWTFTPAQVDGRAVASRWRLRYQFGRAGTQVFPAEMRP
ncbi:MAG TPA: TonB family protein [Candidatus Aquilonibacter sp.]|nr:TonB family protein [Candidatus Aquilonibacter sp.]